MLFAAVLTMSQKWRRSMYADPAGVSSNRHVTLNITFMVVAASDGFSTVAVA
jgi:hypothetical protein